MIQATIVAKGKGTAHLVFTAYFWNMRVLGDCVAEWTKSFGAEYKVSSHETVDHIVPNSVVYRSKCTHYFVSE